MKFSEVVDSVPGGTLHILEGELIEAVEYLSALVQTYPPTGYGTRVMTFHQIGDQVKIRVFRANSAE